MSWNRNLINLRDVLASLYPDQKESRMLVREVGLNAGHIDFDNRAVLNWQHILEFADRQNKVGEIVDVALVKFPGNPLLELARKGELDQLRAEDLDFGIANNWKADADSGENFEKITGNRSTLLDIAFLELGMERSKSVGRVVLSNNGGTGSGFLVEGNILITNNHVFPSAAAAQGSVVQFNYQNSRRGMPESYEEFKVGKLLATSELHDWSAVQMEGDPNSPWGALSLDDIAEVKKDDHVVIIQHPGGGPKQIGLFHNMVTWVGDDLLQYLTDTLPGSSGSPVFNNQWRLVGLHHSGGHLREPGVKNLVYRNEGINIRTVIMGLEAAGVLATRKGGSPAGVHSSAAQGAAAVREMGRALASASSPAVGAAKAQQQGAESVPGAVFPMAALRPESMPVPAPQAGSVPSLNIITREKAVFDPASFYERHSDAEIAQLYQRDPVRVRENLAEFLGEAKADEMLADLAEDSTKEGLFRTEVNPDYPEIVYLHGIMGGHLSSSAGGWLWLNPALLLQDPAKNLSLNPNGHDTYGLEPAGYLKIFYAEAARKWKKAGFHVHEGFSYDWRKPLESAAARLDYLLRSRHRERPEARFAIVAHSMGGLVAATWANMHSDWNDLVERAVFCGSPFGGSFAIMEMLNGRYPFLNALDGLVLRNTLPELQTMGSTMPGAIQMLPSPDLFPDADEYLYRRDVYPSFARPADRWLNQSRQIKKPLFESPILEKSTLLVSVNHGTVVSSQLENGLAFRASCGAGDGTVPAKSFLVPGVPAFCVASKHNRLCNDPKVIAAVSEILIGETTGLQKVDPNIADQPMMCPDDREALVDLKAIAEEKRERFANGTATQEDWFWLFDPEN